MRKVIGSGLIVDVNQAPYYHESAHKKCERKLFFDQTQNESSLEPDAYEKDANWFNGSNTTVHAEKRDMRSD